MESECFKLALTSPDYKILEKEIRNSICEDLNCKIRGIEGIKVGYVSLVGKKENILRNQLNTELVMVNFYESIEKMDTWYKDCDAFIIFADEKYLINSEYLGSTINFMHDFKRHKKYGALPHLLIYNYSSEEKIKKIEEHKDSIILREKSSLEKIAREIIPQVVKSTLKHKHPHMNLDQVIYSNNKALTSTT